MPLHALKYLLALRSRAPALEDPLVLRRASDAWLCLNAHIFLFLYQICRLYRGFLLRAKEDLEAQRLISEK